MEENNKGNALPFWRYGKVKRLKPLRRTSWLVVTALAVCCFILGLVVVTAVMGQRAAQTSAADLGPAPDLSAYPWFYLRDGRPLAEDEPVVELIAVGDVMLGRGVAGVPDPLVIAAPWLQAADLTLGNLESVGCDATGRAASCRSGWPTTVPP
jgi:hypothetical protein